MQQVCYPEKLEQILSALSAQNATKLLNLQPYMTGVTTVHKSCDTLLKQV